MSLLIVVVDDHVYAGEINSPLNQLCLRTQDDRDSIYAGTLEGIHNVFEKRSALKTKQGLGLAHPL